jgi:hypothetical protein
MIDELNWGDDSNAWLVEVTEDEFELLQQVSEPQSRLIDINKIYLTDFGEDLMETICSAEPYHAEFATKSVTEFKDKMYRLADAYIEIY